jgi:endonuclease/exonuclease/phosphatase family metal-dependent hydrolase
LKLNLTFATWNILNGGLDKGDDTRLRRQLALLNEARPDVVALQELTDDFTRKGDTLVHWAEDQLGGMRGFLARSPHDCHLGVFIRESAGLRVIRNRHEQRDPYWHAVACVEVEAAGFGRLLLASAHLAPSSPAKRLIEAEAFKLIAEQGPLIAGGDWNAIPASGPDPQPRGLDGEHIRRKLDRSAARALEAVRLTDAGAHLGDTTPTVGHWSPDKLAYRCDRVYTNLPAEMITGHQVITGADDCSDHRPVIASFSLEAA